MCIRDSPKIGSTSGNILNGKTACLTPICGIFFSVNVGTGETLPVNSLVTISVAILTMLILHTLDTKGTVLEALGLASNT